MPMGTGSVWLDYKSYPCILYQRMLWQRTSHRAQPEDSIVRHPELYTQKAPVFSSHKLIMHSPILRGSCATPRQHLCHTPRQKLHTHSSVHTATEGAHTHSTAAYTQRPKVHTHKTERRAHKTILRQHWIVTWHPELCMNTGPGLQDRARS